MADGPLPAHGHLRQEGARLGRPARARARRDRPGDRLAGHQGRHRPDRLGAARRHAVHARGRERPQRPGLRAQLPQAPDHRPGARAAPADTLRGRGSGNDFGCSPTGGHNLDISLPELADVPAGTPVTLDVQVLLGHRVGLRLRLRADVDRQRQDLQVARRRRTATRRRPPRTPTPTAARRPYGNGITGSSGSYEAGTATVDRVAGQLPRRAVRRRRVRPLRRSPGKASVLRFSYATDPGLARPGWFIDDLVVKAGDQRHLLSRTSRRRRRRPALFNGGCREDLQTAPIVHRRLGARRRPTTARRPTTPTTWRCATAPASTRRHAARTTAATVRRSSRACCSSTPTRPTATATSAPTTRRRRARSTRSPSPERDARTSTTRPSPPRPATRASPTPARATSTTTPTRRATTGCGVSTSTA